MKKSNPQIAHGAAWLLLMLVALLNSAEAATYYVSPFGDDGNNGTSQNTPWKHIDIGDFRSVLVPGDTVIVMAGSYDISKTDTFYTNETGLALTKCSGAPELPIVYQAQGDVYLNRGNNGLSAGDLAVLINGVHYIVFDGFKIKGGTTGIQVSAATAVEIRNCAVSETLPGYESAVLFQETSSFNFHNNTVDTKANPIIGLQAVYCSGTNKVYNNTFVKPNVRGISSFYSSGVTVKNNIVSRLVGGSAIYSYTPGNELINTHNLMQLDGGTLYGGNATAGTGEINADPLFVDYAANNYRLQFTSPAINSGTNVGISYAGSNPDMGAFESSFTTVWSDGFESNNFTTGGWTNTGTAIQTTYKYAGTRADSFNSTDKLVKSYSTVGKNGIVVRYARYGRNGTSSGHFIADWSTDGTTWTTLEDFVGTSAWAVKTYNLPAGAANQSGFQIRFRVTGYSSTQYAYLDSVEIVAQ